MMVGSLLIVTLIIFINKKYLREIYQDADPKISTSVTLPILWDKKEKTIVNNESSEIIRIFNSQFNQLTGNNDDYYPSSTNRNRSTK